MFVFPVTYTRADGNSCLTSYVPVLYLDSLLGMVGGLYFGLRKEHHRGMKFGETNAQARWWSIEGILEASFEALFSADMKALPRFFKQVFSNPFVTASYPLPFSRLMFYQARVNASTVCSARERFFWEYNGQTVTNGEKSTAVFCEYSFAMSRPMNKEQFFKC